MKFDLGDKIEYIDRCPHDRVSIKVFLFTSRNTWANSPVSLSLLFGAQPLTCVWLDPQDSRQSLAINGDLSWVTACRSPLSSRVAARLISDKRRQWFL